MIFFLLLFKEVFLIFVLGLLLEKNNNLLMKIFLKIIKYLVLNVKSFIFWLIINGYLFFGFKVSFLGWFKFFWIMILWIELLKLYVGFMVI